MDKYEYKVRADEIKNLIRDKKYIEAVEIADTIDWRNVKNSMTLCTISDLYKMCKRFEDSRDVLALAYQRNPGGRMILYSLCELSIKLGDVVNAIEYYKEFVAVAPRDTGRYILRYKLYTAQEVGLEERIGVLEELQEHECKEKWMYELAYLYHMQGYGDKCVEECNQIVIYFGEGKYVVKALELKALHEPLSYEQDAIYRRLTGPKENDILVKDMDVSKYNMIDLQKELANGLADVLYDDTRPIPTEAVNEAVAYNEQSYEETYKEDNYEVDTYNVEAHNEEVAYEPLESSNDEALVASIEEEAIKEESVVSQDTIVIPTAEANEKEEPVSMETKVIEAKEIEAQIDQKEHAVSRVVHPSGRIDEMREVLPKSSKNEAILFPNYDDMVSMEGDGQISFNIPEQEIIDKQITGQISIEEVMAEWERMKNANEKKWREEMRRKVIQQANVMFKDFDESSKDGLLEKLESEVSEAPSISFTDKERENLIGEKLIEEELIEEELLEEELFEGNEFGEEIIEEPSEYAAEETLEDSVEVSETETEVEQIEEQPIEEQSKIDQEEAVEDNQDIREIIIEEEPTREELFFDRTPFLEKASEENETTAEAGIEELAEDVVEEAATGIDDYLLAFAAAGEERDLAYKATLESVGAVAEILEEVIDTEDANEEVVEEAVDEAVMEEAVTEEAMVEDTVTEDTVIEDTVIEEDTESESSDSIALDDDSVDNDFIEEDSLEDSLVEEAATEEESTEENSVEEVAAEEPSEPVIRESGFTEEQEERFEAFIQTEDSREQLKEVLANITLEPHTGNAIIGSEDIDSSIDLAKAIIMELAGRESVTGKVAKIKASTLNAKDAEETLAKLEDGALIIQDANELRRETLDAIYRVTMKKEMKVFIVLTCLKRNKHRFIMENNDMLESFTVSMDIEALTNKELAAYAKAYAYSKEFAIDEMGMLALHTRIDERQTNEHSVTVTEVKAIVDEAIEKATKKNVKHFMDVLVGKRYDDNDMVVLKEKDFTE